MYEETYVFYLFFLYTRVHQASPEFILTLTDTLTSYQVTTTREQSKKNVETQENVSDVSHEEKSSQI